jgi:signal transduction histidine kinase
LLDVLDGLIATQPAGEIDRATAALRESSALAQARAFEGFNRLSSFIIHDLKNSVSALSMLTQNARQRFDEPAFRVDALKTLTRTVERMRSSSPGSRRTARITARFASRLAAWFARAAIASVSSVMKFC